jgi:hypothetical protein
MLNIRNMFRLIMRMYFERFSSMLAIEIYTVFYNKSHNSHKLFLRKPKEMINNANDMKLKNMHAI